MCGIAGILAFEESGKKNFSKMDNALFSLAQRGPDGKGIFEDQNIVLGHRRLAIIDVSENGAQPFKDAAGRYTIVFNGEIFNYKALREQLKARGVQFKSQSDTEVLLYLFIQDEEKCLEKLDGEFSFAIYDNYKEELFIARDRFGIKPLYYFQDQEKFIFASEMKAIMAFDIPKEIDRASLQTFLHLNYIPSPHSILKNVSKMEAGTYMKVNKQKALKKASYYKIQSDSTNANFAEINYEDAQKKLKSLVEDSVINRMIADVPLGTFLSGGIDSSIITAIAARNIKNLNTFSVGFKNEPLFDETQYAKLLAKKYNTNHTVFELSNSDLFSNLHHVLEYMDEPFADSSALAVNILCMHTKKQVTVALSGDGADEIFAGYNKHAAELKARQGGLKVQLVKSAQPLLQYLPKSRNSKIGNKIRQLEKFSEGINLNERERYWRWAGNTQEEEIENMLLNTSKEYASRKKNILKHLDKDYNSVLRTDMQLVLENDMLVKVDRMSMSQSLEVRVPFLDHKVVDFAFSLPAHFKIDGQHQKKILKDAFKRFLPEELLNRKKQGFEVPLLKWFQSDLKSMITDDLLKDSFIEDQGIFNPQSIQKLKEQLFSSNPNEAVAQIWGLIVFQYWFKKHIGS